MSLTSPSNHVTSVVLLGAVAQPRSAIAAASADSSSVHAPGRRTSASGVCRARRSRCASRPGPTAGSVVGGSVLASGIHGPRSS